MALGLGVAGFEGAFEEFEAGELHEADLVVDAFLGLHEDGADVSEGRGALGRNAAGGESVEEIAEDVMNVDLSEVIEGGRCKLGGEIGGIE